MKLKLPPVVVVMVFMGLMFLLAKFLPFGDFDFFGRRYLIMVLLVSAMLLIVFGVLQFFGSKTTVDPLHPDKSNKLVTTGLYNFSRNPMYLGMLMILLAWGLWLGNAFNSLLAAGFVSYMNHFQIIPEEKALSALFGKEYLQYCAKVRRWF